MYLYHFQRCFTVNPSPDFMYFSPRHLNDNSSPIPTRCRHRRRARRCDCSRRLDQGAGILRNQGIRPTGPNRRDMVCFTLPRHTPKRLLFTNHVPGYGSPRSARAYPPWTLCWTKVPLRRRLSRQPCPVIGKRVVPLTLGICGTQSQRRTRICTATSHQRSWPFRRSPFLKL